MQREREKKERAAAKREKRQERSASTEAPPAPDLNGESEVTAADLVRLVEDIHAEYEAGTIDLEAFEEKKAQLLARVRID